jgi:integrase
MLLNQNTEYSDLNQIIEINGWRTVPEQVIDTSGVPIITSSDKWILELAAKTTVIEFSSISSPLVKYVVQRYLIKLIETKSNNEASAFWNEFSRFIMKSDYWAALNSDEFGENLVSAMQFIYKKLKSEKILYSFYRISRWYIFCADHFEELEFNIDYANTIAAIKIPGNVKGEAVRSNDPEEGPLNLKLELPLLFKALVNDKSNIHQHVKQRVAVYLAVAFGRNSANYSLLRETDLEDIDIDTTDKFLNIPRIKKRAKKRSLFVTECPAAELVEQIEGLISLNQDINTSITYKGENITLARPLFFRIKPVQILLESESPEFAFHMTANQISGLVKSFSKRVNLISPVTNDVMYLTPRRLRYTFATNMARQGISKLALAEMLDHSDTQHVGVYYELGDEITEPLEKAAAKKIGKLIGFFKGNIVKSDEDAVNGARDDKKVPFHTNSENNAEEDIGVCGESQLCFLDPPFSCYLCPKFQPYLEADHENVLNELISSRNQRLDSYEKARLGIQLDDVIYAVAEVAETVKEMKNGN